MVSEQRFCNFEHDRQLADYKPILIETFSKKKITIRLKGRWLFLTPYYGHILISRNFSKS